MIRIRVLFAGAALMAALLVATNAEAQQPGILEQISPTPTVYMQGSTAEDPAPPGIDFETADNTDGFAALGDVTAAVEYVGGGTGVGCEAADFIGFTAGNIALIDRGACQFDLKINNAGDAGATAVIIGNTFPSAAGGLLTMNMTVATSSPAVLVGDGLRAEFTDLANAGGLEMRVAVIPEPSTLALCGLGLIALLGIRRRR